MSLHDFLTSSLTSGVSADMGVADFFVCMGIALALGIFIAWLYGFKTKHTKGFILTLAILPAVVCMIIMMVNGNIGTGVAVAGTFSLIRFRSVPGTAREIGAIFIAMGAGLATGMGYAGYAMLFTLLIGLVTWVLTMSRFGDSKPAQRSLTITIPESLDYTGVFDDLFETYTNSATLNRVKTTNMGSLFKVTYDIELKNEIMEKELIDDLRCRNGNLEIIMAKSSSVGAEL